MSGTHVRAMPGERQGSPRRNRFFHGKLLDAYHFELETNYFNAKRWLLNRLVGGYGVLCGLNVEWGEGSCDASGPTGLKPIVVKPGIAIDRWGREIIVPVDSGPCCIPADVIALANSDDQTGSMHGPHGDCDEADEKGWVHLVICYHECAEDPMPVLAGDCHGASPCEAGTFREWYTLEFKPGFYCRPDLHCQVPDAFTGKKPNYDVLVRWITFGSDPNDPAAECLEPMRDPCITLANIKLPEAGETCHHDDIDIYARPIVYSNDLLFQSMLDLASGQATTRLRK